MDSSIHLLCLGCFCPGTWPILDSTWLCIHILEISMIHRLIHTHSMCNCPSCCFICEYYFVCRVLVDTPYNMWSLPFIPLQHTSVVIVCVLYIHRYLGNFVWRFLFFLLIFMSVPLPWMLPYLKLYMPSCNVNLLLGGGEIHCAITWY